MLSFTSGRLKDATLVFVVFSKSDCFLVSCFLVPVKIFSFYFYILCCVSSIVAVYQHRSKKLSTIAPVFKNVGERSAAKSYRPGSLLFVVSKVFKKLVNNRLVDHLEEYGLFSDF